MKLAVLVCILALAGVADAKVVTRSVEYKQGSTVLHCFTHKDAGTDPSKGCAYDASADARSWSAMRTFFDELFGPKR